MKKCQDCNFRHEALLENCWQCGSRNIVWENANYVPQSAQSTVMFRSETPTYYAQNQQNYNTNAHNYATNSYQTPKSSAGRKLGLVIGGVFTFFLLFSAVGAATYFKFVYRPVKPIPVTRIENPVEKQDVVKKEETVKEEKKTETTERTNTTNSSRLSGSSISKKNNSTKENAELVKMWVDYNVKEDGLLGMRIHVSFKTYNMKDMRSYLALYFEKRDGTPLKTKNKKFASTNGQLALYKFITPGYESAVYDDIELFLPYDELNLGRGKFNLTISADVIYEKGGSIDHLKDYDFIYEEK